MGFCEGDLTVNPTFIADIATRIRNNMQQVIVGQKDTIDLLLVALICLGHALLEDVPGTGKTMMAKSLAKSLACSFTRVQFTPDLLPSDLSGINFYNQKTGDFQFRPGPLFTNILLADEINRATPRTQSSLLECMEERQITIDGETHGLDRPFFVIATQNPVENQGTFPLPEAQLDRFLVQIKVGYPSTEEGIHILRRFKEHAPQDELGAVATIHDIREMQNHYSQSMVSDDLLEYIMHIVETTRVHQDVSLGVSPRGSQALLRAVQAYAAIHGRDYVIPDDIKKMAKPVLSHRLILNPQSRIRKDHANRVIDSILGAVAVPSENLAGER